MCGRFVRSSPAEVLIQEFGVTSLASAVDLHPRYNVCPGEKIVAIVAHDGERRLGELLWGLGSRAQINVRAERLGVRPSYREALRHRRCLVVADGFYEWQREGSRKIPYFVRLASHRPFAFAGIWERRGGAAMAAIVTCPANERIAEIHDRMPAILLPEAQNAWLDPATTEPTGVLQTIPAADIEAYRVSTLVNAARNDSPECIRPVEGALRLVGRDLR